MFGWQEGNAAIKFSCRMRTEFGKGDSGEMKLLVFGTGEYYQRFKKWLVKEDIVALLDNSPAKQNTVIDGHEVLSPKDGIEREYDAVIVMSFYIKAMRKQLIELGVSSESIYHFYDLRKLIDLKRNKQKVQFYGNIALLSTDLALGGTAIALFQMAKVLKQIGYPIVFASMMDGPLKEWLEECGIPVIIDPNLQLATMREIEWLSDFRLIICNAVNYYLFLSERDLGIPMVWWLHDSSFFYDGVDKEILQKISTENLTVLAVGPIPEKSIHLIVPKLPVGQLLYGRHSGKRGQFAEDTCREEEYTGQNLFCDNRPYRRTERAGYTPAGSQPAEERGAAEGGVLSCRTGYLASGGAGQREGSVYAGDCNNRACRKREGCRNFRLCGRNGLPVKRGSHAHCGGRGNDVQCALYSIECSRDCSVHNRG